MVACRSCGALVVWAVTATGRRMPVDAMPTPGGNIILRGGPTPLATVACKDAVPGPAHTSHFATCPQAVSWRKPRDAAQVKT